ncbi:RNA methyltransferase [Clostridiaceae bacterium]|jgi:TrmH family RNA methyltransferase|nr:RNA methyltransferase [Clostridiaceae bacterium]
MITSTGNNRIRAVSALVKKAKARREQKLFIAEGPKLFSELPRTHLRETYVSESFLKQRSGRADALLDGCAFEIVSDEVMRFLSDTRTPQGILAVAEQFSYTLSDLAAEPAHLLILETLQDPGNLGTLIRAAEGAGATGIVMNAETADIYSPKVIRSAMGSVFRMPFVYVTDLKETLLTLKTSGICLYAAHLKGSVSYDSADYTKSTGFLIGNEAGGLTDGTAALADTSVRIPMEGQVESLNAAVAASVLMFEAARQRRNGFYHPIT